MVIFSGSETHKLEEIFGDLPVWLAAENGVFVRPPPEHVGPPSAVEQNRRVSECVRAARRDGRHTRVEVLLEHVSHGSPLMCNQEAPHIRKLSSPAASLFPAAMAVPVPWHWQGLDGERAGAGMLADC